ncbi:MAG: diguanylate cyclase [Rubrivivax sp.]|nr:diguanylate cyclase [Rubrivivax sp.]
MTLAETRTAAAEEDRLLEQAAAEVREARSDVLRLTAEGARLSGELAHARRELDATRAQLAEARLAARSDALTGLPNRRAFDAVSARTLAAHRPGPGVLALLFVDLDGFKAINDRLGHAVGDELLRAIGARLAHAVRRGDLICRYGGDEFLCLLPDLLSRARALAIARTLVRVICAPCQVGPHRLRVRASIGVALHPRDGLTVGALLQRADEAMFHAKARGGGVAMATDPAAGEPAPAGAGQAA